MIACSSQPTPEPSSPPLKYAGYLPAADTELDIPSLSPCSDAGNQRLRLNSTEPVNVIVHGCFSSAGRFRALADVFAFHGQQAICFNYDDRQSLKKSASELAQAIDELASAMPEAPIHILGHSQGGLVARNALAENSTDVFELQKGRLQLTTVSSPFAGIAAAAHCGSRTIAWLSLGLVKPICQLITGAKYRDIPQTSAFIQSPGRLGPGVERHLRIVTDERGSCRRFEADGSCAEDDFVFSVAEQEFEAVDGDLRVVPMQVRAGHVAIVGDENMVPLQLIEILQQHHILRDTPAQSEQDLLALLDQLYREREAGQPWVGRSRFDQSPQGFYNHSERY